MAFHTRLCDENYMSERALYKWFFYYPVKKAPADKRFYMFNIVL